jgi:6-phosphogluconate dehydrogenase
MPMIIKGQDIMPGLPYMRAYTEYIGFTRTIAGTNQNSGCCSFVGNVPAAHLMIAIKRGERNVFGRKVQFIGAKGIVIKCAAFLGSSQCFNNIHGNGKENA